MKNTILLFFVSVLAYGVLSSCSNGNKRDVELIPVKSGGKWGYIDHKGKFVINPQYYSADFFYCGLAKVEANEGDFGYINKKGDFLVTSWFTDGTYFQEGYAFVVKNGTAPICIDDRGKELFTLDSDVESVSIFQEGLSVIQKGGKCGYINTKGEIVINPQYDAAFLFSEGAASVKVGTKWGHINKDGSYLINPQYEGVSRFQEGLAWVKLGGQWGAINKDGQYVINPQFNNIGLFFNSLATIFQPGIGWGAVDKDGQIVINPQFEQMGDFSDNGFAFVRQGGKTGYINKDGKYVINPQFDYGGDFYDDFALIQSGGKIGCIDTKGKIIINPQFESASVVSKQTVESGFIDVTEIIEDIIGDRTALNRTWGDIFPEGVSDGDFKNNRWSMMIYVKNPLKKSESIEQKEILCFDQNLRYGDNDNATLVAKYMEYSMPKCTKDKSDLIGQKVMSVIESKENGRFNKTDNDSVYYMQANGKTFICSCAEGGFGVVQFLTDNPAAIRFMDSL